ncbi:MAG: rhodanese-like domain-containing protein [Deltaproteobacteria bacterium]|nr:rhodanese-like domain-containing protein [Deltaproteobacteria bacterium]
MRELMGKPEEGTCEARLSDGLGKVIIDALVITLLCALAAVVVNRWGHPKGIPLVAPKAYEILVPCPEPGGVVTALGPGDARIAAKDTFRVDAREAGVFKAWHLSTAMNVTYDYLDPTPKDLIKRLAQRAASSRAQQVVVYGDGEDPDTGEQLGKELSGHGIKNVFFVRGGAPALRKAARP